MSAHWLYWNCKLCLPGSGHGTARGHELLAAVRRHLAEHEQMRRVMFP